MLLSASQQWALSKILARKARGQPLMIRERMMKRSMLLAMLAQKQWRLDLRTPPCPPWTLEEMGLHSLAKVLYSPPKSRRPSAREAEPSSASSTPGDH